MKNKEMEPYDATKAINRAYSDGLNDAWECARKLVLNALSGGFNNDELNDIFGDTNYYELLKTLTASEAMAKIKKYNEGLKVGDEVMDNSIYSLAVVTKLVDKFGYIYVMYKDGSSGTHNINHFTKTGRHFPQIREFLKQMQDVDCEKFVEECNGLT